MCSRVKCGTCQKFTWSGCGEHVEQALAGVPADQLCTCGPNAKKSSGESGDSIFARLFGR
jgi:hypothetical protein